MDLKLIKPKHNKVSDKYSWNLYEYLNKYKGNFKVYYSKINAFTEKEHTYNKESLVKIDTIISIGESSGDRNSVIGCRLDEILRKVPKMDYYYGNLNGDYIDITQEFIQDYIDIGRCLFDTGHTAWMRGDEDRFAYESEDIRKCNWCNLKQFKHIETYTKELITWQPKEIN